MLKKLKEYNKFFVQNTFLGDLTNPNIYEITNRDSYVCLSAPHSTKTIRKGKIKKSDLYTGALCKLLGENNLVTTIIRNKYTDCPSPLIPLIIQNNLVENFILDIHGMRSDIEFELAVGIGVFSEQDYFIPLKIIDNLCQKYKISYQINHPSYTGRQGLTGRLQLHSHQPNIIQLELRKDLRDFMKCGKIVKTKTLPFLNELIKTLNANEALYVEKT